jgi:acyl carrier protein phosphodiesterase
MNYLGHLFFSNGDNALALANLHGDFVKGSDFSHLSILQQKGVRLHRDIDDYMDHHVAVKNCITLIRSELPKVAPIAMDLYFDHLLAKNWNHFSSIPLIDFLNTFYTTAEIEKFNYNPNFQSFITALIRYDWLNHYALEEGLVKMCNGVAQKLSFENKLINGFDVFKKHETIIQSAFYEYMSDANEHFLTIHSR